MSESQLLTLTMTLWLVAQLVSYALFVIALRMTIKALQKSTETIQDIVHIMVKSRLSSEVDDGMHRAWEKFLGTGKVKPEDYLTHPPSTEPWQSTTAVQQQQHEAEVETSPEPCVQCGGQREVVGRTVGENNYVTTFRCVQCGNTTRE